MHGDLSAAIFMILVEEGLLVQSGGIFTNWPMKKSIKIIADLLSNCTTK
jgi:hypothetical protein